LLHPETYLRRDAPRSRDEAPPLGGVEICPTTGLTEKGLALVPLLLPHEVEFANCSGLAHSHAADAMQIFYFCMAR
jgi:hypothetical protein